MFGRMMVAAAFFLNSYLPYRKTKTFFYNFLENPHYPYKKYFDYVMMGLIFLSVYILIYSVKNELSSGWLVFNNYVISVIFLVEYLLRVWTYSDSSKIIIDQYEHDLFMHRPFSSRDALKAIVKQKVIFITSPMAIVDILAIMPFFHEFRVFRIFVLFRVLKLFRYAKSLRRLISILSSKKFELLTLAIFAAIMIMISSVLIYVMEANNVESKINTLPDALYWSVVTIFTVGYGDIVPVTQEGRAVAMLIIVSGIAVISVATSIVVSAFTEKLDEIKMDRLIDDVRRLEKFYLICGYSALTHEVIRKLHKRDLPIVVLEKDQLQASLARAQGFLALQYDSASLETYHSMKIHFDKQVEAIILLHESDVLNIYAALTIRELSKVIPIFSILHTIENRKKLTLAGINAIVNTHELIGLMSKLISAQPVAFEVMHALRSEETPTVIDEIHLDVGMEQKFDELLDNPLFYKRLSVLGVYKFSSQTFLFNPDKLTGIEAGDVVIVVANRSLIEEFRNKLHRGLRG